MRRSFRWTSAARVIRFVVMPAAIDAERAHAARDDDHAAGRERAAGDPRREVLVVMIDDAAGPRTAQGRGIEGVEVDLQAQLSRSTWTALGLIVRWTVRPDRGRAPASSRTAYGAPLAPGHRDDQVVGSATSRTGVMGRSPRAQPGRPPRAWCRRRAWRFRRSSGYCSSAVSPRAASRSSIAWPSGNSRTLRGR